MEEEVGEEGEVRREEHREIVKITFWEFISLLYFT